MCVWGGHQTVVHTQVRMNVHTCASVREDLRSTLAVIPQYPLPHFATGFLTGLEIMKFTRLASQ